MSDELNLDGDELKKSVTETKATDEEFEAFTLNDDGTLTCRFKKPFQPDHGDPITEFVIKEPTGSTLDKFGTPYRQLFMGAGEGGDQVMELRIDNKKMKRYASHLSDLTLGDFEKMPARILQPIYQEMALTLFMGAKD